MNKVALLLPNQDMCDIAASLIDNYHFEIIANEAVQNNSAVSRARELESQGVDIIISRGYQAEEIKKAVQVTVVQIHMSTQEVGLVVRNIKHALQNPHPRIAIIALGSLLGDTTHYNEIFDTEIDIQCVRELEEYDHAVDRAILNNVDAIVGGRRVCTRAKAMGTPVEFLHSGREGIANALAEAQSISYALSLEKQNTARMQTVLDNAFEGIMQINKIGLIQSSNSTMDRFVGKKSHQLIGKSVAAALPGFPQELLTAALEQGIETFGRPLALPAADATVTVAPIHNGSEIEGAILTFLENNSVQRIGTKLRQNLYQLGYVNRRSFDSIIHNSKAMRDVITAAKNIAKYNIPVLITGEAGTGKDLLARCIHTDSPRRENGYIYFDCAGYEPATMETRLFGNPHDKEGDLSLIELAQDGTLYLNNVEQLTRELQYRIYLVTQGQFYRNGQNRPVNLNVRVIGGTAQNLSLLLQRGAFNSDLYYALTTALLELPPLRLRREDIPAWADYYMEQYRKKYSRYIQLNQNTYDFFRDYHWPGNLNQLKCVCERVVLYSPHRTADTVFVQRHLGQIYPETSANAERIVVYKDRQAVVISELLKKHNGNRESVAAELGISKTTLWRKIKKYGISSDYSL